MCKTRSCKYSLDAPDDERKYLSKHVEQPRNNNYPTQLHLVGHFLKLYYSLRGISFVKNVCRFIESQEYVSSEEYEVKLKFNLNINAYFGNTIHF